MIKISEVPKSRYVAQGGILESHEMVAIMRSRPSNAWLFREPNEDGFVLTPKQYSVTIVGEFSKKEGDDSKPIFIRRTDVSRLKATIKATDEGIRKLLPSAQQDDFIQLQLVDPDFEDDPHPQTWGMVVFSAEASKLFSKLKGFIEEAVEAGEVTTIKVRRNGRLTKAPAIVLGNKWRFSGYCRSVSVPSYWVRRPITDGASRNKWEPMLVTKEDVVSSKLKVQPADSTRMPLVLSKAQCLEPVEEATRQFARLVYPGIKASSVKSLKIDGMTFTKVVEKHEPTGEKDDPDTGEGYSGDAPE